MGRLLLVGHLCAGIGTGYPDRGGVPGGLLKTYMKAKCNRKTGEARPEVAMKYYEFNREKDLKEEDDEQGS